MFITALLLAQASSLPSFDEVRFADCQKLIESDAPSALVFASEWKQTDSDFFAQACFAGAQAANGKFAEAATHFEIAATAADHAGHKQASGFRGQAGNAALAAGLTDKAISNFTMALADPTLSLNQRAEFLIDRARTYVSSNRAQEAEGDLRETRRIAPDNKIGWLLSATLARRSGKLEDAQNHIVTAAKLSPSDAAIALEAGNIAAAAGAYEIAKEQWLQTIRIAPQSAQADSANRLLKQLAVQFPESSPSATQDEKR